MTHAKRSLDSSDHSINILEIYVKTANLLPHQLAKIPCGVLLSLSKGRKSGTGSYPVGKTQEVGQVSHREAFFASLSTPHRYRRQSKSRERSGCKGCRWTCIHRTTDLRPSRSLSTHTMTRFCTYLKCDTPSKCLPYTNRFRWVFISDEA